jgi:hypothetical protein
MRVVLILKSRAENVNINNPTEAGNNYSSNEVDVSSTTRVASTTLFNDDANVTLATINQPLKLMRKIYDSSSDNFNQDIKTFLSKPVILRSGSFGTGDTVSTFGSVLMPFGLINAFDTMSNKLEGFLGFRATMVFRLTVNANPFQQGRYMVTWTALGGAAEDTNATKHLNSHIYTLVQRSTLPRVEIDIACDTVVELRIPFISKYNFYPLSGQTSAERFGSLGYVSIFPYVPLNGVTNVTAGYTLWGHFEDVELICAAVPQSGASFSDTTKEAKDAGVAPISNTLSLISKSAGVLSAAPGIGAYASGISWLTERLAKTAMVFGWSKPINNAPVHFVQRGALTNYTNVDSVDNSSPISLSAKNEVHKCEGFSGTEVDELDFSYMASIPAYDSTTSWTFSGTSGTLLKSFAVAPLVNVSSTSLVNFGVQVNNYKPMDFVAQYFTYWRGSIVYKFKIVKTDYHSGRLAIAYTPFENYNTATKTASLALTAFTHRHIVDIRETNEVTITVPYISSTPYRPTSGSTAPTGTLYIYILDPLTGPASVANTISIVAEICGGPDFEVAVPANSRLMPVYNVVPQSGASFGKVADKNACALTQAVLGVTSPVTDDYINAAICVGEKVSSFRSLLKSYNMMLWSVTPVAQQFLTIRAFASPVYHDSVTNAQPTNTCDLYGVLSSIFLFNRGGVRYKVSGAIYNTDALTNAPFYSLYNNVTAVTSFAAIQTTNGAGLTGVNATSYGNLLRTYSHYVDNLSADVTVPSYHYMHSRLGSEELANANLLTNQTYSTQSRAMLSFSCGPIRPLQPTTTIHRAASDDANFGGFISIPPMTSVVAGIFVP